jgi:diaminopimelate epimerase
MGLTLLKYEAIGNDFVVLVDPGRAERFDAALAEALCDRRRGIGADGLMRIGGGGQDLTMELRNADGGVAETSGNGLRCAVLAAIDEGLVESATAPIRVRTLAGTVTARCVERDTAGARLTVGMGELTVQRETSSPLVGYEALTVDVGNPHLVLLAGAQAAPVDIAEIGPVLEASRPGGVNVEVVEVRGPGVLALSVWERGAGRTLACGSGSCAAAAAARLLGRSGDAVLVENPGGALAVRLSGPPERPSAVLEGPARRVAEIIASPALLADAQALP